MPNLSSYRLTIIGAIIVLVLSAGFVLLLGTPDESKQYLALVATVALPALLSLFKSEQNSQAIQSGVASHADVKAAVAQLQQTVEGNGTSVSTGPGNKPANDQR